MPKNLIVPIADLVGIEGNEYLFAKSVPAPENVGVPLIGIPEGEPIELDLRLSLLDEGVLVQGEVSATAVGQCARCLKDVTLPMHEHIAELVFHPERQEELVAEGDEEAADMPVAVDDRVDLEPLMRDELVLAMPLSPLCRPDCPGLCAECGEPWEELPEDHKHEFLDPRFSALDVLAKQLMAEDTADADNAEASDVEPGPGEPSA